MRRADRLFDIVQHLRGGRLRTAQELADLLEVSVRTIYRDIDTVVGSGVPIEGERGIGYVLRDGMLMPPLAFTSTSFRRLPSERSWSAPGRTRSLPALRKKRWRKSMPLHSRMGGKSFGGRKSGRSATV